MKTFEILYFDPIVERLEGKNFIIVIFCN